MPHPRIVFYLGLLIPLILGCGATVFPPAHPAHPVAIFVSDYGHHSSVTLPLGDSAFVEYSFGDWNYMAQNHTSARDALQALFFSPSACFGRRYSTRAAGQTIPAQFGSPKMFAIDVPAESVARVESKMESRWQREIGTKIYNADDDTDFVIDDCHYSWANNCNEITALTLLDLNCQVEGFAYFSAFQLGQPR